MKVFGRLLLALVVAALLLAPMVYAQEADKTSTLLINPAESVLIGSDSSKAYDTIIQGEKDSFSQYVWPLTSSLMVDTNWGDSSDSLALTINTPDSTLGPFYDGSDGIVDGRIVLRISNPGGYLPIGTWKFSVYGYQVQGVEDYTFIAY